VNVPELLERLKTTSFYLDETLLKCGLRQVAKAIARSRGTASATVGRAQGTE